MAADEFRRGATAIGAVITGGALGLLVAVPLDWGYWVSSPLFGPPEVSTAMFVYLVFGVPLVSGAMALVLLRRFRMSSFVSTVAVMLMLVAACWHSLIVGQTLVPLASLPLSAVALASAFWLARRALRQRPRAARPAVSRATEAGGSPKVENA